MKNVANTHRVFFGDAYSVLRDYVADESIQLMVTSPPYWNVRNYGHPGQIGFGDTLKDYLNRLDEVWREVARALLPDGKLAVNIGNIYYSEPDEKRRTGPKKGGGATALPDYRPAFGGRFIRKRKEQYPAADPEPGRHFGPDPASLCGRFQAGWV